MRTYICLVFLGAGSFVPAVMRPLTVSAAARTAAPLVSVEFRLRVQGVRPSGLTYWVAYGPLQGKFGLVRLHAAGTDLFAARASLPHGRTIFSYVVGHGVLHTRYGQEPGGAASVVERTARLPVTQHLVIRGQWSAAPQG